MRIEKDFLGEVEIADELYYGVQTTRAITNFPITGQPICREFIRSLGIVKCAAARANGATGRMEAHISEALATAALEVADGKFDDQFVTDSIQGGAGTSINMNTNEVITNRALELIGEAKGNYAVISPNNHANMAQSTNDVFPTAMRITAIELTEKLMIELALLRDAFYDKGIEFKSVIKMGRTHLQDAVPITLGQEFEAYGNVVQRAMNRIQFAADSIHHLNMGATAVGTGLNAEPEYIKKVVQNISALTGKTYISPTNLIDATQNCDQIAALSSTLRTSCVSFCKIASDLRLMASGPKCGPYEIKLPARQPGSSIMPGKVNPVMPEVLNQTCYAVMGNDLTVVFAVENGQLELNVMEPVMAYKLFDSFMILTNAIRAFRELCVKGIEANVEHCHEYVETSFGICTALLPYIGYEQSSYVVKEALATGRNVKELIIEKGLLSEAEMSIVLDPENMTSPGISGWDQIQKLRESAK